MGPQVFAPGPKPSLVLPLPALGFDSSVFPGPPVRNSATPLKASAGQPYIGAQSLASHRLTPPHVVPGRAKLLWATLPPT
ncbi:hypothetical protein NQZ68_010398 [Dissostichus eleginoides]|nr:hypothetical protein NQZ68_010398 [Dissostichus eleginoides]